LRDMPAGAPDVTLSPLIQVEPSGTEIKVPARSVPLDIVLITL
jgi:hypothetical protein